MEAMNIPNTIDEDEMFEGLPLALRRQVMAHWSNPDASEAPVETSPQSEKTSLGFIIPAVVIGTPIAFVGLVLSLTILFAPVGIPLMLLGAYMPYRAIQRHSR